MSFSKVPLQDAVASFCNEKKKKEKQSVKPKQDLLLYHFTFL